MWFNWGQMSTGSLASGLVLLDFNGGLSVKEVISFKGDSLQQHFDLN